MILPPRPASSDAFFRPRDDALKSDSRAAPGFLAYRNDLPRSEDERLMELT